MVVMKTDTWGYAGGRWEWQRSSSGAASEEFADMFLGWVYGAWEMDYESSTLSVDGQQRSDFMNTWMLVLWIGQSAVDNWRLQDEM